jgi:hypothetical protein
MKIKLMLGLLTCLLGACSSNESTGNSHETENVLASIDLPMGESLSSEKVTVLKGEISPFDSSSGKRIEVKVEGTQVSFAQPGSEYWIEVILDSEPNQIFWSFVDSEENLDVKIQLEDVASVRGSYSPKVWGISKVGIEATNRSVDLNELGEFHMEDVAPGLHQFYGWVELDSVRSKLGDSLVFLGSFEIQSGENIIAVDSNKNRETPQKDTIKIESKVEEPSDVDTVDWTEYSEYDQDYEECKMMGCPANLSEEKQKGFCELNPLFCKTSLSAFQLSNRLDGNSYSSVEEKVIGETENGTAMGNWNISFDAGNCQWRNSDVIETCTYTTQDSGRIDVEFFDRSMEAIYKLESREVMWSGDLYSNVEEK